MAYRATTILNRNGDVTVVWDETHDDVVEEIIKKKMAEGITFFVIEPRFGGVVSPAKTRLTDPEKARHHRALAIPDEDFARFVGEGKGDAVPTPAAAVKRGRKTKDPKEVAKSESIGVRPLRGG